MTKLGLFVIVLCALLALTCGARVVRDTPVTPTSSDTTNVLSDAFDKFKATVEDTMTKENFDKVVKTLTDVGDKLKEVGEDFVNKIQEKTAELTKKE